MCPMKLYQSKGPWDIHEFACPIPRSSSLTAFNVSSNRGPFSRSHRAQVSAVTERTPESTLTFQIVLEFFAVANLNARFVQLLDTAGGSYVETVDY